MSSNLVKNKQLPKGWLPTIIGDLLDFEYGKGLTKKKRNENGKFPVYGSNGIVGYHTNFLIEAPALIIGRKGAAGEVSYSDKNCWPIDTTYFINNLRYLNIKFVFYVLKSLRLNQYDRSTAIPGLNRNDAYELSFNLPPFPEQNQIVAKIEELFSELDNGIESLKKAREQLKTYRQAVLKYAFEGKLTKGSVKAKNVKIKDLFTLIDGDRGRNYPKKDYYLQKGFCLFLSTKNVRFGKFEFYETVFISEIKHNELHSGTLKRGDIVITTRGTIGNVAFYDERIPYDVVRINSGMLILRAKSDKVYEKYFLHYVGSPMFWNQIQKKRSGTAQPQLPAGVLKEFDIPLFAKGIQRNIVQEIESRLSVCDKIEQTIEDSLKKAEALRQSILKKAFAGELTRDWREKHPELIAGENSAEKLLEKIKAEKAIAASRKKPRSKKTKKK